MHNDVQEMDIGMLFLMVDDRVITVQSPSKPLQHYTFISNT